MSQPQRVARSRRIEAARRRLHDATIASRASSRPIRARSVAGRNDRWLLVALVVAACGGSAPPLVEPPDVREDLDAERVAIAGIELPRMPLDVAPQDVELEEGWALAERALSMPTPRAPTGEADEVEQWAEEELTEWIGRRADALARAQRALEPARTGAADYSVVASAVLGLAYSRFAMELRGIPAPDVFASSPERADAFQRALTRAAGPLWQRALDAFGSCASVAGGAPAHSLDAWREFCDRESRAAAAMIE